MIAIGPTASDTGLTAPVAAIGAIAFCVVGGLWWCYFDWVQHATESRLVSDTVLRRRSNLARDLYTLGHRPIIAGIVVFAVGVEESVLHPTEALHGLASVALPLGPALHMGLRDWQLPVHRAARGHPPGGTDGHRGARDRRGSACARAGHHRADCRCDRCSGGSRTPPPAVTAGPCLTRRRLRRPAAMTAKVDLEVAVDHGLAAAAGRSVSGP